MGRWTVGQKVGNNYIIDGVLGEGAMGTVYRAHREGRPSPSYALKQLNIDGLPPDEREEAEEMFRREADILTRLSSRGLPSVIEAFTEDLSACLVMECIEGDTLENLIDNGLPLSEEQAIPMGMQLLQVLRYLHTHAEGPIIFKDLKPANVMVQPDGRVKLVDFGIARIFKPGQARDTYRMGTPGYAAPEQWTGDQSTPATDLYGWAVTMHYMLSGHHPQDRPGYVLPPIRKLAPDTSIAMEQLLEHCLQLYPEDRPQSADEVLEALSNIAQAQGIPLSKTPPRKLPPWLVVGLLLALSVTASYCLACIRF